MRAATTSARDGTGSVLRGLRSWRARLTQSVGVCREQLSKLSVHVEVASRLSAAIDSRCLTEVGALEQAAAYGDAGSKEVIALLTGPLAPRLQAPDKVRAGIAAASTCSQACNQKSCTMQCRSQCSHTWHLCFVQLRLLATFGASNPDQMDAAKQVCPRDMTYGVCGVAALALPNSVDDSRPEPPLPPVGAVAEAVEAATGRHGDDCKPADAGCATASKEYQHLRWRQEVAPYHPQGEGRRELKFACYKCLRGSGLTDVHAAACLHSNILHATVWRSTGARTE